MPHGPSCCGRGRRRATHVSTAEMRNDQSECLAGKVQMLQQTAAVAHTESVYVWLRVFLRVWGYMQLS